MLQKIIRFSVRNKLIIGLFTLALVVWGSIEVTRLPLDALPDITSNQVQVITVSPTLAAPEVERLITFPIEQAVANIPGIVEMRSISRFGLSVITVVFKDDVDYYFARQQVSERLGAVKNEIPPAAGEPELAPATTGLGEIYQYVLRPAPGYESTYNLKDLRTIQDWIVRRQLIGTPGVADISSFGGYLKQYEVAVKPARLKSMGVTITEIFDALEKNNENSGGSYIEKGPAAIFIKTEGLAESISDIEKIPLKHLPDGTPVLIKDVAEVKEGHAVRYGALTYRDKGEVAGGVVLMLKNENASRVIDHVKERIENIQKTLPEGIILETFYDRTKMVDRALNTIKTNLTEAAIIVLIVLIVFLGNLRAGIIVASLIPLAMLFAVIMMNIFGVSGNLMSLGALDFGLIVDGGVIVVEAVLHGLFIKRMTHKNLAPHEVDREVETSAGKLMSAAVFGQMIILIVYFPILSLSGIEGKMFRPMAQTVLFALMGAFLLSMTYVPMITSLLLRKHNFEFKFSIHFIEKLQHIYGKFLTAILNYPRIAMSVVIGFFLFSLFIFSRLGGEFIPEMEEGDFAVDARIMTGANLGETIKTTQEAVAMLENRFPEVEKIITRIGASEIPTDPMPMEMTDLMITLKPKEEWTSAASYDELADKMSAALAEIPGLSAGFQFPIQMRFNELISGARQDVVCKIFGENLDTLTALAAKVEQVIHSVEGTRDVYIESITGLPHLSVRYHRDRMAKYGLNVADVNRLIRTAYAGESAGYVYENERKFDLVVRLDSSQRKEPEQIGNLFIATPSGLQVPLAEVAEIVIKSGPHQIQREDAKRRIIAGFNVRSRDVRSVVEELDKKISENMQFPSGYYIRYGGQFENLNEATSRLAIAVPATLILIFILLFFAFHSLKYVLLIFTAIPLSAIGGVFALWLRGMPFSVSSGVGFIALFGVAVLNSIVLISEFNRLKKTKTDLNDIIMEGAKTRLRPVLITASVASLGFLPMALSQSAGAEVQRPLATVVIGGLISATCLTLIVIPILYRWIERKNFTPAAPVKAATIMLLLMLGNATLQAQKRYSLDEILRIADSSNPTLQAARLEKAYWNTVQSSVFSTPQTELGLEYGQVNSPSNDTKLQLTQAFNLPHVYQRRKSYYASEAALQEAVVNLTAAELHKAIKISYYRMRVLEEERKIYGLLDSLYRQSLTAARSRLDAGESDILETHSAEINLNLVAMQLQDIAADYAIAQRELQYYTNTGILFYPEEVAPKINKPSIPLADNIPAHPGIMYYQSLIDRQEAAAEMEKSARSPEISLGYINQSFKGYYSEDGINQKQLTGSDRFHSIAVVLGIPIFNKSVKTKIRGMQLQREALEKRKYAEISRYLSEAKKLEENIRKLSVRLDYFEKEGLEKADKLIQSAGLSFSLGNMNYTEWAVTVNNAVNLKREYLNTLMEYNQLVIELEYLTQNALK